MTYLAFFEPLIILPKILASADIDKFTVGH